MCEVVYVKRGKPQTYASRVKGRRENVAISQELENAEKVSFENLLISKL